MKKIKNNLKWLPFAISLSALIIYIVLTIKIKMKPSIIVTDQLIGTLKIYLIVSLLSLFVGLLILLIKKIYKLSHENISYAENISKNDKKVVIPEEKEEKVIIVKEEKNNIKINNEHICPECGSKISKKAAICPYCGILFDKEIIKMIDRFQKKKNNKSFIGLIINIILIVIFIVLIIFMCNILRDKYNENIRNINSIINKI